MARFFLSTGKSDGRNFWSYLFMAIFALLIGTSSHRNFWCGAMLFILFNILSLLIWKTYDRNFRGAPEFPVWEVSDLKQLVRERVVFIPSPLYRQQLLQLFFTYLRPKRI